MLSPGLRPCSFLLFREGPGHLGLLRFGGVNLHCSATAPAERRAPRAMLLQAGEDTSHWKLVNALAFKVYLS